MIALGILWLSITFFLLIFSLVSIKEDGISFYVIPPRKLSFFISYYLIGYYPLLIMIGIYVGSILYYLDKRYKF